MYFSFSSKSVILQTDQNSQPQSSITQLQIDISDAVFLFGLYDEDFQYS